MGRILLGSVFDELMIDIERTSDGAQSAPYARRDGWEQGRVRSAHRFGHWQASQSGSSMRQSLGCESPIGVAVRPSLTIGALTTTSPATPTVVAKIAVDSSAADIAAMASIAAPFSPSAAITGTATAVVTSLCWRFWVKPY